MSFLGFTLWFFISAIILGASAWSASILLRQKHAWETFAKKHNMAYQKGKFLSSPTVTGTIGRYRVAFFAAERQAYDVRQRRMLTGIEITLPDGLIDGGAVGTKEMLPFMNTLNTLHPFVPDNEKWDKNLTFYVRNEEQVKAWLTDERLAHILAIVGIRNADCLFLFDGAQAIVRIETPDPLTDAVKMDKAVQRIMRHGDALIAA